jgi:ParB family chromosome partitioning protein
VPGEVLPLALAKIDASRKLNVRDDVEVEEIAASMKRLGLLAPVAVVETEGGKGYRLVFGFRRFAAAKSLGWERIDARVLTPEQAAAAQAAENIERVDLTLSQEVDAVGRVKAKLGKEATAADVAAELGKQPVWAAQRLALVRLHPDWWKRAEEDGRVTRPLLYALARLSRDEQAEWLRQQWMSPKEILQRLHESKPRPLAAVGWDLSDKLLVKTAGACDGCEYRGDVSHPLFPDAQPTAKATCLNGACYDAKVTASLKAKAASLKKELGKEPKILVQGYERHPFDDKEVVRSYDVVKATPETKGAFPVLSTEGKQLGQVQWVKPAGSGGASTSNKSRVADPEAKPKSDAERLRTLKRRRLALAVRKYSEQLPKLGCRLDAAVAFVLAFGTAYRHEFGRDSQYDHRQDGEPKSLAEALDVKERDWPKRLFASVVRTIQKRLNIQRVEDEAEKAWSHAEEIAVAAGHHNDLVACLAEANAELKTPKSLEAAAKKLGDKLALPPKKRGRPPATDRRKAASGERD